MKPTDIFLRFILVYCMLTPQAFSNPWELSIDGVALRPKLVEKDTRLRLAQTSVCLTEYDYFRMANFVQVEVGSFGDRLASALAEHVQICEDSKAVIRRGYDAQLKLQDGELKTLRDDIVKKSIELTEQKDQYETTILYHQIGLAGTTAVIVVLSVVLLR